MGCDGGTIPKRDELVRVKKKPEQKDKVSELSFLWQHCNISQEPLRKPIVACGLGRLYNKDTVLEKLLEKAQMPESAIHIKRLRDIKDLNLTPNPAYKAVTEKGDNHVDRQTAPYICPVTGLEMNGKFKFCFYWSCGCVLSERAMKQFDEKHCLSCQKAFTQEDIVVLNATTEDLDVMKDRLEKRASSKSNKKKVKNEPKEEASSSKTDVKVKAERNEASTSKITSNCDNKRSSEGLHDPAYKKTKQDYSVSSDPNASDVYKSLFTTHKDAKTHNKAHWVTYNPFYN